MLWYSLDDIVAAYRITKVALKQRIKSGKLKSQKLPMNRGKAHKTFKYIIPESELPLLEALKLQEPKASPSSQPDYYQNLWRKKDEEQRYWQEYSEEKRRKYREQTEQQYGRYGYDGYYDYIRSAEWQEKRMQRLMMDGFRCKLCGSGINLQVHHISYDNMCQDAEIDDLVTLCKTCHEKVHSTDLERKANPSTVSPLYVIAVYAIRTKSRAEAWETFERACKEYTPPPSAKEISEIWLEAVRKVNRQDWR